MGYNFTNYFIEGKTNLKVVPDTNQGKRNEIKKYDYIHYIFDVIDTKL